MLSSLPALSSHPHPWFVLSAAARPRGRRNDRWFVPPGLADARDKNKTQSSRLGFHGINYCTNGNKKSWSGFARRCKDWDGEESDFALEAEILVFMSCSEKPEAFPTRKELINGGRTDLVDAILRKRGWMSFGWASDDEEEEITVRGSHKANSWSSWEDDYRSSSMASFCPYDSDYSRSPSSSGRSLENETNESGIEGILSRLDKERNLSFGFDLCNVADNALAFSDEQNKDSRSKSSINGTVAGLFKSSEPSSSSGPKKAVFDYSTRRLNQNHSLSESGSWRSWSTQRAGVSNIDSKRFRINGIKNAEASDEPSGEMDDMDLKKPDEITHNQIRSRLQNLELELSTVLHSVRSNNADENMLQKHESTSNEIQNLTDAWELQQNEIMNARAKLRSTRAKIAVFEGKRALALIEAQKIVEQKQRRVDDARRALRLLRSTSIVWPNSASEVLLAGSFDGWASKRKMEKSRRGIFSLGLQLYPGKYEIKFIVDGEWRIDPLRPTVKNNGFENNLLIVT